MKKINVVAAIIKNDGFVFATQRGTGDFKGGWEFPGGKIEAGESPADALMREIKEELDIEIKVGELFDVVEYDYPNFHLSMQCFWCTLKAGKIVLKEHQNARWMGKHDLDSLEWLPADLELIEKLKKEEMELFV